MHNFKDRHGKEWSIEINIGMAKKIKAETDFDIIEMSDESQIFRLSTDVYLLGNILYILCKEKADERNIKEEDFAYIFSGQSIQDAVTALMEELSDFFPNPLMRELMKETVKKIKLTQDAALGVAKKELDKLDVEEVVNKAYETQKEKLLNKEEEKTDKITIG